MKITHIMLAEGFGGAERYFVDIVRAQAALNHQIQVVIHPQFRHVEQFKTYRNIHQDFLRARGRWDILARWKLQKIVNSFAPNIIHGHMSRGTYFGGIAANHLNIPLITKTHNYVDLKYYRQVSHFITTTQDLAQHLLREKVDPAKISTIPCFSLVTPANQSFKNFRHPPCFVAMGRFVAKKGFDVLLRAFSLVLSSGHPAHLRIAGSGPEQNSLVNLVRQLGIESHVEFVGWRDDIISFLKSGDIFVLPSLDEPFGIVVIEAMAAGVPIIATRTQGPSEILCDQTAFLTEIDNVQDLADAMSVALLDQQACRDKAQYALERYTRQYHHTAVVPQIMEVYQALTTLR